MKTPVAIVLIYGAGLGSFIWEELQQQLDRPSLAIDFPNRNKGDKANESLSFQSYITATIGQINQWNKGKFVLITHSIGGCIGLKIAEHFQENVVGFIALSAAIPANRKSFVSCLPFPKNIIMPLVLRLFGTKPPAKSIEHDLCNGLTKQQTAKVVNGFSPESIQLYTHKISYKKIAVPSLYIELTNDNAIPLSAQKKMATQLGAETIETIDGGHLAMMSHASELTGIINAFVQRITNP